MWPQTRCFCSRTPREVRAHDRPPWIVIWHNARRLESADFPYTALIVGGVVMIALAVVNKVVRYALVRYGLVVGPGRPTAATKSSALGRFVAALGPVWHFLGYDTYAEEQQAAAAAAEASSLSTTALEPLLPTGSSSLNHPDAASAGAPKAHAAASAADTRLLARLRNRIRSIDAFRCVQPRGFCLNCACVFVLCVHLMSLVHIVPL